MRNHRDGALKWPKLPTHKPSSNEEEPLLREVTTRKPTATAARVEQTTDGVVVRVALESARGVSLEVVNGLGVCVLYVRTSFWGTFKGRVLVMGESVWLRRTL